MQHDYGIESVVFICGGVLMVFELVGSRILAPYLGTSIIVWTSLIGVILGSLSVGYALGGKAADTAASRRGLSEIIFVGALCITLTAFFNTFILVLISNITRNISLESILAALVLFGPASLFLGMVSPYAVRLRLETLKTSGTTIGNLYAISTVGSITGTFLGGFFFIAYFGTFHIVLLLSLTLLLTTIALNTREFMAGKHRIFGIFIAIVFVFDGALFYLDHLPKNFVDKDTQYNRIWIFNTKEKETQQTIKVMRINNESSSAMFLNSNELVYPYTLYYRLDQFFVPTINNALMIGGGGYSYPKEYLRKFPAATLDVVEIDPTVTQLAREYFNLKENTRLKIYSEDGRMFLNQTNNRYDVIYGDAFKGYSPPYNLTTQEAVIEMYNSLQQNGAVLVNIVSSLDGDQGKFLRAEYFTFRSIFPQVYLFPVDDSKNGLLVQNIMLVALKSTKRPQFQSTDKNINSLLSHIWKRNVPQDVPMLTDDFVPVEEYMANTIN